MRSVIILIGFISIISCSDRNKKDQIASTNGTHVITDNEKDNLLGILNQQDTLKILVEFSECGEWGGHRELMFLKRNEENKVFAQLFIDSISCDSMLAVHNTTDEVDKSRVIIVEKEKILTDKDEQTISEFIKGLLEIYLTNNYLNRYEDSLIIYEGSGTLLRVTNTNSTFNLTFWNIDNFAKTNYSKVRDLIFNKN
jgi:hypothetical protein